MLSFSASGGREKSRWPEGLAMSARGLAGRDALLWRAFRTLSFRCLIFIGVVLFPFPVVGSVITLAWDPSDAGIAGYRLYYGVAPRTYPFAIDVGPAASCSVSNLVPGTTYFFAVTAYSHLGAESDFSDEIVFTPALRIASISADDQGATLSWKTEPSALYRVLASQTLNDLVWVDVSGPIFAISTDTSWTHVRTTSDASVFYRIELLAGVR